MSIINDHEDLLARANRAVRAALGDSCTVEAIQKWGGGAHNQGYQLHLAGGGRLFWKVEKDNIFPRTRRGQVEREVTGIRLASEAGLDCPRILGYDTTGKIAGCRYLIEEFVEGDLLGEAMQVLGEVEQAALLAEFQARARRLALVQGGWFGEIAAGGPLGQHAAYPELMRSLSTLLIEDARTLDCFSGAELDLVRRAHAAALGQFAYGGPPAFIHLDMHIYNSFAKQTDGAVEMGKLFDFGLCLYLAPYAACYNEKAFGGEEARLAREYGVSESELHAFHLLYALEFCNFITTIGWAPDKPYGYVARRKEYLEQCAAFLNMPLQEAHE